MIGYVLNAEWAKICLKRNKTKTNRGGKMKAVPIRKDIYWVGGIDWESAASGILLREAQPTMHILIFDEKILAIQLALFV